MSQFRKYLNKISDNYFADLTESPVAVICDWDFDTELWSYDFEKANIRIALHKK